MSQMRDALFARDIEFGVSAQMDRTRHAFARRAGSEDAARRASEIRVVETGGLRMKLFSAVAMTVGSAFQWSMAMMFCLRRLAAANLAPEINGPDHRISGARPSADGRCKQ